MSEPLETEKKEPISNTVEPTLPLKLACECVGTFGLCYTVVMTATVGEGSGVPVPVCAAFYLILMVYAIGSVSGCHINPGVSTAVFLWGAVSGTNKNWMVEYPLYVLVQLIGGIVGGLIAIVLTYEGNLFDGTEPIGIYPYRDQSESPGLALVGEMLAIFFFTLTILRVCCDHDKPPMDTDGIVIGIALMTAIVGTAVISGGAVNPAVATSLRVVDYYLDGEMSFADPNYSEGDFFLVYWVGPIIGAFLSCMLHYLIESATSIEFTGYEFLHDGRA